MREYPNRNKAIGMSTGKYLIFIDGDDIIFPHGIAFYVSQLEAFPEAAIAIQKNYYNNLLYPALFQPRETIANALFGTNLLTSSFTSNFFRTEILKSEGMLSTLYITGDDEIRFRLAVKYPVLFVAGWVSWPRETPGQSSSNLKNGIGLVEFCSYYEKVIKVSLNIQADDDFNIQAQQIIKQAKVNLVKESIKKLKWKEAFKLMNKFEVRWVSLFTVNKIIKTKFNFLHSHNSVNPFKRGFLERGV
jgi:glycosyltransferase involved in cell wall biosynthesis